MYDIYYTVRYMISYTVIYQPLAMICISPGVMQQTLKMF